MTNEKRQYTNQQDLITSRQYIYIWELVESYKKLSVRRKMWAVLLCVERCMR